MNAAVSDAQVVIHHVSMDDYKDVAQFLKDFRGKKCSEQCWLERFACWWERNPFFNDSMVRGWILRDAGRLVGFLGLIPLRYQWQREPCLAMTPTSWFVLPQYRRHSLRLFVEQLEYAQDILLWDTTPTREARQISLRLGFTDIPYRCQHLYHVFKSWADLLEWHARARGIDSWWPARLRRVRAMWPSRAWTNPSRMSRYVFKRFRTAEEVDASFDRLWERTRHIEAYTRVRSSAWVRWYCFAHAEHPKKLIGCYQDGNLMAYAIFYDVIKRHPSERALPVKMLECLDFWHDPQAPDSIDFLMRGMMRDVCDGPWLGLTLFDFPGVASWIRGRGAKSCLRDQTPGGLYRLTERMRDQLGDQTPYFLLAEGDVGL